MPEIFDKFSSLDPERERAQIEEAVANALLPDTAVVPGSYTNTNLTVDQKGRITAAADGEASEGGSGLTDFANDPDTTTGLTYGYKAGVVRTLDGGTLAPPAGTITLTDDAVNYFYFYQGDPFVVGNSDNIPFGAFMVATITTVAGAIPPENIIDTRAFANTFGSYSSQQLLNDLKATDGGGLNLEVAAGILTRPSGVLIFAGNTLPLDDDSELFVEMDINGNLSANGANFTPGRAPIAEVETAAGEIIDVVDRRGLLFVPGPKYPLDLATDFAVIVIGQNGSTFTNDAAGPDFIQTLPLAGFAPARLTFEVEDADTYIIVANGANAINLAGILSGDGGAITSDLVGSSITLQTDIAGTWFAQSIVGEWSITAP